MSELSRILRLTPGSRADSWLGLGYGPAGKRAYGGQFVAQSLLAAAHTVTGSGAGADEPAPTSLHLQFLRGGDATEPTEYQVERTYDGRTAMTRRVLARQGERLITAATVSFSRALDGPQHGHREHLPADPEALPATGPVGPAPGLPLEELDIRVDDHGSGVEFIRRLWWRATVALPDDPVLHAAVALFTTDVYGIDPALQVHGHSMRDRTHRSGTTDTAVWLHRPIRADKWNLLESRSPAGARGRGVVTASLVAATGDITATLVQEGIIASRETSTNTPS